jgi:hypothetical protein
MLGVGLLVEMTFIATYFAVKGEPKEGDVNRCPKLTLQIFPSTGMATYKVCYETRTVSR